MWADMQAHIEVNIQEDIRTDHSARTPYTPRIGSTSPSQN